MAAISRISLLIITGSASGAGLGTGAVFFGFGGREFRVDSIVDPDFPTSGRAEFIIGEPFSEKQGHRRLRNPELNNLTDYEMDEADARRFPSYIRLDPGDSEERWQVENVEVNANIATPPETRVRFRMLNAPRNKVWLSNRSSHYLYLLPS